jgi:N-acyl-D-amino-acid deacylase
LALTGCPTTPSRTRAWGTFARILGHYSRRLSLFPLEIAVHKMTGLPAKTFGLKDRGLLKPGMAADITIFDADEVDEAATFTRPIQAAKGIDSVIVNGTVVWHDGKSTGARPGQVLVRGA